MEPSLVVGRNGLRCTVDRKPPWWRNAPAGPIGGVGKRCCLDGLRAWRGPSDQSGEPVPRGRSSRGLSYRGGIAVGPDGSRPVELATVKGLGRVSEGSDGEGSRKGLGRV